MRDLLIETGELRTLLAGPCQGRSTRDLDFACGGVVARQERRRIGTTVHLLLQCGELRNIKLRLHQITCQAVTVRASHRGIEFDQRIPGVQLVAILHMDCTHDAGLQRLDHLHPARRNHMPLRRRYNVHFSKPRPRDRNGKGGNDRPRYRAAGR